MEISQTDFDQLLQQVQDLTVRVHGWRAFFIRRRHNPQLRQALPVDPSSNLRRHRETAPPPTHSAPPVSATMLVAVAVLGGLALRGLKAGAPRGTQ